MANMRYFTGDVELTASTVCYRGASTVVDHAGNKDCLAGIDPARPPIYVPGIGWGGYFKVERAIEYKAFPSRHECDARCMNATGRVMRCECACGGRNHGRGTLACEAA